MQVMQDYDEKKGRIKSYSCCVSLAQKIPNGNTLIDQWPREHQLEVIPEKEIVQKQEYDREITMGMQELYRTYSNVIITDFET